MQRILLYVQSIIFIALAFAPDSSYAWKWSRDKFHSGKSGRGTDCFIDKLGNYAYWFCENGHDDLNCCNGLCRAAGQYKKVLKDGEVLTASLLTEGESDIDTTDLADKYICCHGGKDDEDRKHSRDFNGEFIANESTERFGTVTVDGAQKTCRQKVNACGTDVGDCEVLCPNDGEVVRVQNGQPVCKPGCTAGQVYESETSYNCVDCPVTLHSGPVTVKGCEEEDSTNSGFCKDDTDYRKSTECISGAGGECIGYTYCETCPSGSIYVPSTTDTKHGKCVSKNDMYSFSQTELKSCWRCATSEAEMRQCICKGKNSGWTTAAEWSQKCCDAEFPDALSSNSECSISYEWSAGNNKCY